MDLKKRKLNGYIALSLLIITCLIMASVLSLFVTNNSSKALISTTSATKVGNGAEIWDSTTNSFNGVVVKDLFSKLFGQETDWKGYIKKSENFDAQTQSYVVPASTINAQVGNSDYGLVLTLGGLEWMITSLTLTNDAKEDAVVTLYLANGNGTSTFHNNNSGKNKMVYSVSELRSNLLADENFKLFSDKTEGGFAQKHLVQPKNIKYQLNQSMVGRNGPSNYNYPNDALGAMSSGWSSGVDFQPDYTVNGVKYDAWGEDYIWTPSGVETGYSNYASMNSLWKLSTEQLKYFNINNDNSTNYVWIRSGGNDSSANMVYLIKYTGSFDYSITSDKAPYGIRPAIHLNLNSLALATPTNILATYNGEYQTLETLKKDIGWYSSVFEDSNAVEVAYLTENGSPLETGVYPIDRGNYKVKLTILKTDIYTWADSKSSSDVTREVDLEIKPAKLNVNFKLDKTKAPPVASATPTNLCDSDSSIEDTILMIHYTGTYGKNTYDKYNEEPSNVGNYTAKVEIDKSKDEKGNYVLDNTYSESYSINPNVVTMPSLVAEDGKKLPYTYNGNQQYIFIDGYYSNLMEVNIASDYQTKIEDLTEDTVTVKNAGNYDKALVVTLQNAYNSETGEGLNVWNATSKDTQAKYLSFVVNKAEIKVDVYEPTNKIGNVLTGIIGNSTLDVMIELSSKPAERINLTLTAQAQNGNPADLHSFSINSLTSSESLPISSYKVPRTYTIDVKTDSTNYDVKIARDISLSIKRLDNPNLTWLIRDTSGIPYEKEVDPSEKNVEFDEATFEYNGKAYTIEVSEPSGYNVQGSVVTVLEGTTTPLNEIINAGTYITKVKLVKDGTSDEIEYSIKWTIDPTKIDLSSVKWKYDGKLPYNGGAEVFAVLDEDTIPKQLTATYEGSLGGTSVGGSDGSGTVTVRFTLKDEYQGNYVLPVSSNSNSYKGNFEWSKQWEIVPATIKLEWTDSDEQDEDDNAFKVKKLSDESIDEIVKYVYYETDSNGVIKEPKTELKLKDIHVSATERKFYVAQVSIKSGFENNYRFPEGSTEKDLQSPFFSVGGGSNSAQVSLAKSEYEYNNGKAVKLQLAAIGVKESDLVLTYYIGDIVAEGSRLDTAPSEVGNYLVVISARSGSNVTLAGITEYEFKITKAKITTDWKDGAKPPVLDLKYGQINGVEYEITDEDGNLITFNQLQAGKSYKIRAKIKSSQLNNYIFDDGTIETDWQEFSVREGDKLYDPNDPNNPNYPQVDPDDPNAVNPNDPDGDGDGDKDNEGGNSPFDKVSEVLKQWWQVVASVISIILIIIFTSKGISYANQRKKIKRTIEKRYSGYYAVATTGLFGWAYTTWTVIASILMGVAVLSFIFMLLEKRSYNKALEEMEDAKEEYERNQKDIDNRRRGEENQRRDEQMQMMLMGMLGGNANGQGNGAQGGFAYQQGLGAEEIRGIVSETMTALLPSMQQMMLPQQASTNDELVQKLIEQNAQNEERIEKLMERLAEQKPVEKIVEKEVASTIVSDETLDRLASRLQPASNTDTILKVVEKTEHNDETIKKLLETQENLMRNQDKLMEKILELSNNKPTEPQVVEKIVEVPVEKIVEKEVKVEVPVEVEKIVEKEVVKEVPIEVEKVVEKIVEIPAEKPAPKAKKAPAPRLTLDEAYAKLSASQKKIFDTLKAYAMSKDKCKEKKSTYFIVLGQSTVNPLVKLTIKKNTTVALFKMEDEYMKDIRKNATSDGTKVKVKETELIVGDNQALSTAKEMIDLREDQIERYNEYLREQRSMKRK